MAKMPLKIAVIGTGRWGKNIVKTLGTIPECEVAYTSTHSWKELLKKTDIDGVVVATPPGTHAAIALAFIQKKIPTFIEKPMTTNVADAKRIVKGSRTHKTPVFVGHVHLYNPAYIAAKKEIKKAGKLHLLFGEGASNGPFRDDYSAMWDWAPHDVAMMIDIAGTPSKVEAWGKAVLRPKTRLHDITNMKLDFPGGPVGVIHSSKLSPEKRRKLTIVGSKNGVLYDDTAEKKVTLFRGSGPTVTSKKISENQPTLLYPTYAFDLSLAEELKAFVDMVKTRKQPRSSAEQGLAVVAVLEAAEKSIAQGGKSVRIKI